MEINNNIKIMKILMSVLLVLFLFVGQAVAQDACVNETGAAYGLCQAYCEYMDCDNPDNIQATEKACNKVKDKLTPSSFARAVPPSAGKE